MTTSSQVTHITERDMLRDMRTGRAFSITYVTYSHERKEGGAVRHIQEAQLMDPIAERQRLLGRTLSPDEVLELRNRTDDRAELLPHERRTLRRNPNHSEYYTRNIRLLSAGVPTEVVRKIRPPLVILYNGKTVVP